MAKLHWTQTPEGREKMRVAQERAWEKRRLGQTPRAVGRPRKNKTRKRKSTRAEKVIIKHLKRGKRPMTDDTTLVINGWRIVLGHREIRIER